MTETNSQIDQLLQKAEACGKTTLELYKLKGVAGLSKVIASYALSIIIGICLFIALIFLDRLFLYFNLLFVLCLDFLINGS